MRRSLICLWSKSQRYLSLSGSDFLSHCYTRLSESCQIFFLSGTFTAIFSHLNTFVLSHYRCTRWIQWDYLCLWADLLRKNTHHGGTVALNNSKGWLLAVVSPPLLDLTIVHSPPSMSSLAISLYQPTIGTNLHYTSLWETTLFLFKSKSPSTLLSFTILCSLLLIPRVWIYPALHMFLSRLFLLVGEPSWSPGDGNHPADRRGHLWTHICHEREPRIPHKGWCGFPCVSVHMYRVVKRGCTCTIFGPTDWDTFGENSARAFDVILTWTSWVELARHQ